MEESSTGYRKSTRTVAQMEERWQRYQKMRVRFPPVLFVSVDLLLPHVDGKSTTYRAPSKSCA